MAHIQAQLKIQTKYKRKKHYKNRENTRYISYDGSQILKDVGPPFLGKHASLALHTTKPPCW